LHLGGGQAASGIRGNIRCALLAYEFMALHFIDCC
jgi:hypothetical protein